MKVVLLNPTPPDVSAFGVRSLSASLRAAGHDTRIIFYLGSIGLARGDGGFVYRYPDSVLEDTVRLCEGADLVGVSYFTSYADRAEQLMEVLRERLDVPIICGGIHATTRSEEVLGHADMVCVGEGEETMVELCARLEAGRDLHGLEGLWFKDGGEIIRNPLRPLIRDIDSLPPFDFSNEDHFILDRETGRIEPLAADRFQRHLSTNPGPDGRMLRTFRTMTDRGCPHHCAYCNVATLREMYRGDPSPYLRSRTPERVIDELVDIKERFPQVEAVQFFDDTFFARPLARIQEIAALYKERVGLPMYCQASPNTLTEAKLTALIDAGCVYVEMGVQTGSPRIREMYRRSETNEKIVAAAELLHRYRDRLLPPDYHIILDNPWETREDMIQTLALLDRLPRPFGLCISSLTFFPETALYHKARAEGLLHDELSQVCRKAFYVPPKRDYVDFMVYLMTLQGFPAGLRSWLVKPEVARRMARAPIPAQVFSVGYATGEGMRLASKGVSAVRSRDWRRFAQFYERLRSKDPVVAGRKK